MSQLTLLPIAVRPYYCPTCGNKESHCTNHQGEIYCRCKACGNSPLYCADVDSNVGRPYKTAVLHMYKFYRDKLTESLAYDDLRARLKGLGYKKNATLDYSPAGTKHLFSFSAWREHDGRTIKLFDPEQFEGQYISDIGRVFDWKEAIYPNRMIKEGYWLEMVSEQTENSANV